MLPSLKEGTLTLNCGSIIAPIVELFSQPNDGLNHAASFTILAISDGHLDLT